MIYPNKLWGADMGFTTLNFIYFCAGAIAVYYLLPYPWRKVWLLAACYFFYMFSEPAFGLLILAGTAMSYFAALAAEKHLLGKRKLWIALGLIYIFSVLFFFKYAQFFCQTLAALFRIHYVPSQSLVLPVGISFFSFAIAGYLFDVYRGKISAERSFPDYALFVAFFPTLLAGPIGRAREFLPQLKTARSFSPDKLRRGFLRFVVGAAKKMVLADTLAVFVASAYTDPSAVSGGALLLAAICYSLQIYIDFAAYSDMAIGTAEMLGFTVTENFTAPYLSASVQSFWKKWHISLTSWFREYLYFPLGGSRKGQFRAMLNVLIVFAVSGLWHGAAWSFVVWGLLNGAYQVLGRLSEPLRVALRQRLGIREENKLLLLWRGLFTFALITVAWIFFRAASLDQAVYIIKRILLILRDGVGWASVAAIFPKRQLALVLVCLIPCIWEDLRLARGKAFPRPRTAGWLYWFSILLLLLLISVFGVYGEGFNPQDFLYFNF